MQTTIRIQGMSCGHCVRAVENTLKRLPDVTIVKVAVGEATIETGAAPDMAVIRKELHEEGYEVV